MNIFFITVIFVLLQLLIKLIKIIIQQLLIEEEVAYYGEIVTSVILSTTYYFCLLHKEISPLFAYFSAVCFGVYCFVGSWLFQKIANDFFGWGEEDQNLEPFFPLLNAFIVLLVFVPSGFGATIGIADLFYGKIYFFLILLFIQFLIVALVLFILTYFGEPKVALFTDIFLHQMIPFLVWTYLNGEDALRGHVTILTMVLICVTNIETIIFFYLAENQLDISCMDDLFWKVRGYIFSAQITLVIFFYIFPLFTKIFSFFGSIVS